MPADARAHVRKLPSGKWQLRYYDAKGWHAPVVPSRELVEVFLERHAIVA